MFSPNRAERRRCIDFVRALDEAAGSGFRDYGFRVSCLGFRLSTELSSSMTSAAVGHSAIL